jgi:hypothetical protein
MSVEPLARTHALLRAETAIRAALALRGATGQAEVEGLVELVYEPRSAREALAALEALEGCSAPLVRDALGAALDSPHATVRLAAVEALRRWGERPVALVRLLERDESWPVRRAALEALADEPGPGRWRVLAAADDPHWRVRHALIGVLLRWGEAEAGREEIEEKLRSAECGVRSEGAARVEGVRRYLRTRWQGEPGWVDNPHSAIRTPQSNCPFWDWDPAVLARNLERLGEAGRRAALEWMPLLLGHADERVRGLAADTLRAWGGVAELVRALEVLDEPRGPGAETVGRLFGALDLDRAEAVARFVLHARATPAQLAWALDQAGSAFPFEVEEEALWALLREPVARPAVVRCALTRLAARWPHADAKRWLVEFLDESDPEVALEALRGWNASGASSLAEHTLARLLGSAHAPLRAEAVVAALAGAVNVERIAPLAADPDAPVRLRLAAGLAGRPEGWAADLLVRLQADPHPHVRAAALTTGRAAELMAEPGRETSWHVLAGAARLTRTPLWHLQIKEPHAKAPGRKEAKTAEDSSCLLGAFAPLREVSSSAAPPTRLLGPERLSVAPLGISGHYGLPVEGFVRALESGVNLMFWEPNYRTLTEFFARLAPPERRAIHLVAGTFEAEGERVRRDAERALRLLKVERLAVFLLFWVRSWDRIAVDVYRELERLQEEGKVGAFGLSTHVRGLAVEALEAGWDPVMVRHSAAHRGAEEHVFPRAVELGASLITFNNTCYGRLLQPGGPLPAPGAADCYRYALAQPGVRCCLSAPATLEQLEENLAALREPGLPEERLRRLQAQGAALYAEETTFRRLVRSL